MVADKCMKVVGNQEKPLEYEAQFVRAKAPKGLIELVNGNTDLAEDFFDKSLAKQYCDGILPFMRYWSRHSSTPN
ncbi:hypothetical protein JHK87_018349 [Glycine soja]|nr:hypothetical protein JHK87_018349 [Glycine soja]